MDISQNEYICSMGKILITGTGRSGTSFLVHLLSALGMDTGYTEEECAEICNNACQAGAENTIEKPYKILKNPEFMVDIEEIVNSYDIDHVIIPVRKLDDVGSSRENNADNHGGFGGFWNDCETKEQQMNAVVEVQKASMANGSGISNVRFGGKVG